MLFFGRKNYAKAQREAVVEQQVAPGTQMHYDDKLIRHFLDHHRALVDLISKIEDFAQASRFEETGNT